MVKNCVCNRKDTLDKYIFLSSPFSISSDFAIRCDTFSQRKTSRVFFLCSWAAAMCEKEHRASNVINHLIGWAFDRCDLLQFFSYFIFLAVLVVVIFSRLYFFGTEFNAYFMSLCVMNSWLMCALKLCNVLSLFFQLIKWFQIDIFADERRQQRQRYGYFLTIKQYTWRHLWFGTLVHFRRNFSHVNF